MYRYSNGQISLADFKQPVGMNLKESNRWVRKAQTIPWLEIEKRYAALFTNRKGNVAKPLRLALGACIIQAEYGYSDEETALQIQENPYLQYFCGYPGYDGEKLPFDPSLIVYAGEHGSFIHSSRRTCTLLKSSDLILELLEEKSIEQISVAEIAVVFLPGRSIITSATSTKLSERST